MRLVMHSQLAVYSQHVMVYAHGDDVYIALRDVIPHRSRSSLHRGLQRHVILPKPAREKTKTFKSCMFATG